MTDLNECGYSQYMDESGYSQSGREYQTQWPALGTPKLDARAILEDRNLVEVRRKNHV